MANISSFKMAAGIFGMAALVKITVFATALAMLGVASSAQAGTLGKPCTVAPQNQWLSVEAAAEQGRSAWLQGAEGEAEERLRRVLRAR